MRPEKANRVIFNDILKLTRNGNIKRFKKHLKYLKSRYKYHSSRPHDQDFRSGYESYGYSTTDKIRCDLEYVSDRWKCSFRLKWLIDGLENNEFDVLRG